MIFGKKLYLDKAEKYSKRIFEGFRGFGQKWLIFAIFSQKIRFLNIFFKTPSQNFL